MAKKGKKSRKKKKPVVIEESSSSSSESDSDDVEAQQQQQKKKKKEPEETEDGKPDKGCGHNHLTPWLVREVIFPSPAVREDTKLIERYIHNQRRMSVVFALTVIGFGIVWDVWQFTVPFAVQELVGLNLLKPDKEQLTASILICTAVSVFMVLYTLPFAMVIFTETRLQFVLVLFFGLIQLVMRKFIGVLAVVVVCIVFLCTAFNSRALFIMSILRVCLVVALVATCKESTMC